MRGVNFAWDGICCVSALCPSSNVPARLKNFIAFLRNLSFFD